ncbi:hypothetical protein RBH26_18710 [Natronolimnohabitans sp. A-GB9]|uniref:DUF7344 domain-containing protein n=1 Tax=Natronolimnohabitans sp. A-GB9 TaxID=3069757 RepID=UPI0027B7BBC5|nr:hypothetical protein [Natronolimnohabitans sp. A-GB9]MDQ2052498.1 hypothetical protein [Natronolimnohabitans sp. A-GB9]
MIPPANSSSPARPVTSEPSVGTDETAETAMGLLASRRRRAVLRHLKRVGGSATLADVAAAIATETRTAGPRTVSDHGNVSRRQRRAVRLSLHHVHVPKLADADAIDYDSETRTLTLREHGRTLLAREGAVCGPVRY